MVEVLLLRWEEDDMGVQRELRSLDKVLTERYNFKTHTWLIPSKGSHRALMGEVLQLVKEHESRNTLFIVYYAGHGKINPSRQSTWLW
jgi:hypothetical protein